MEKKKNHIWFWLLNGLIAIVAVFFVIENWTEVSVKLFGLEIRGYGFLVFIVIFLMGFGTGWLWSYFHRSRIKRLSREKNGNNYEDKYLH
jgi:uncharacterized integral membrane protein